MYIYVHVHTCMYAETWVLHDIKTRTFGEKVHSWNESAYVVMR